MMWRELEINEIDDPQEFKLSNEEVKILNDILPKGYILINPQKSVKNKVNLNIKNPKNKNSINGSKKNFDFKYKKPVMNNMQTRCYRILTSTKNHRCSIYFLKPVDPHLLKIPDYFDYVKEPMDLSTVEKKLKNGDYFTPSQFKLDMNKIWNNAMIYNTPDTFVYKSAQDLCDFFLKIYEEEFFIDFKDINKLLKRSNSIYEKLHEFDDLFIKNYENFPTENDFKIILKRLNYLNYMEFENLIKDNNIELINNEINLKSLEIYKLKNIYQYLHNKRFLIHSRIKKINKLKNNNKKENEISDNSLILDFDEVD